MTTLGNVGNASVEDRAVECLAAIAYAFEDAMDDLAFLDRAWEASPPASVSVARLIAAAMAEPLDTTGRPAEPGLPVVSAEQAEPVAAVQPAVSAADPAVADEPVAESEGADLEAAELSVADLETATDLEVVSGSEPAGAPADTGPEVGGVIEQVRALFAEAVTAEIPVQSAA